MSNYFSNALDLFEAKHGTFQQMLSNYAATEHYEDERVRRLLRIHDRLCSNLAAYQMGYAAALRDSKAAVRA